MFTNLCESELNLRQTSIGRGLGLTAKGIVGTRPSLLYSLPHVHGTGLIQIAVTFGLLYSLGNGFARMSMCQACNFEP